MPKTHRFCSTEAWDRQTDRHMDRETYGLLDREITASLNAPYTFCRGK